METTPTGTTPAAFTIAPNTWGHKMTKLKNRFSQLNADDLRYDEGREDELVGRLRARLNMSEVEVHQLINAL